MGESCSQWGRRRPKRPGNPHETAPEEMAYPLLLIPVTPIGFASVVSIMPEAFRFRMASGLVQLTNNSQRTWELMVATLADGSVAILIILAMTFGLLVPKLIIDYVTDK